MESQMKSLREQLKQKQEECEELREKLKKQKSDADSEQARLLKEYENLRASVSEHDDQRQKQELYINKNFQKGSRGDPVESE